MPEKLHIGIDAGFKERGFTVGDEFKNYFTLVAVTCSDINKAQKAANQLEEQWPNKKGKNLHSEWKRVIDILLDYPLKYYVLLFDKKVSSLRFQRNFRNLKFPESTPKDGYNAIYDTYAKHGWLVIDVLRIFKYQGPTEIRVDKDLEGLAWKLYKKKVRDHANNCLGKGLCDIADAGDEYPLIKIADIIANFSHWQLRDKIFNNNKPEVLNILGPQTLIMTLCPEPDFEMIVSGPDYFTPW